MMCEGVTVWRVRWFDVCICVCVCYILQHVPAHGGGGLCVHVHGAAQQDLHPLGAQRPDLHAHQHHATGTAPCWQAAKLTPAHLPQPDQHWGWTVNYLVGWDGANTRHLQCKFVTMYLS